MFLVTSGSFIMYWWFSLFSHCLLYWAMIAKLLIYHRELLLILVKYHGGFLLFLSTSGVLWYTKFIPNKILVNFKTISKSSNSIDIVFILFSNISYVLLWNFWFFLFKLLDYLLDRFFYYTSITQSFRQT